MKKIEILREYIAKVIKSKAITQSALAEATDVDGATISRFYKKGEGLSTESYIKLSKWVNKHALTRDIDHDLSETNLTVLGVYAVAGAGPSWEAEDAEPIFNIAVPARYLRPHIIPLFVSGTSMEPTILNQAVVGVNREQREIVQGKMYAVRLPYEGIVVKRLYIDHEHKRFVLKSDNKKDIDEFPDVFLSFEESDSFIYGQVSWVLQSYDR